MKEATKSLNASSKPKQILNKKYSLERGASTGTCSKAELGVDIKAWAGQSCSSQGTGTQWWNMPWTCPKSPFATLSYQASLFIHANGAEGKINVKAKELNVKQHISLVLFLYPTRPISW